MPAVDRAAAPASRNMDLGGYGSRLALRLAGTTEIVFQTANFRHDFTISRPDTPELYCKIRSLDNQRA